MQAAIVAIGDELTSGQRVDTNSAWLSLQLGEIGIPVAIHLTTGDDLERCASAFGFALGEADVVIATGGLGPTQDDITRDAIAAVCGSELALHEPSRTHLEELFKQRGRPMPPSNLKQAMIPRGCQAIPNPHGSAPGIEATVAAARGALDAVCVAWGTGRDARDVATPRSSQPFSHVAARPTQAGDSARSFTALCAVSELVRVHSNKRLQSFWNEAGSLRLASPCTAPRSHYGSPRRGATADDCHAAIERDMVALRQRLGQLVFGEGEAEIQDALITALARADVQVATSERRTRGLVARWLAEADRGGQQFAGGVTAAQADPLQTLEACRIEAERVSQQFAAGATIVIGNIDERGDVPLLVQFGKRESVRMLPWSGHPDIREERTAKTAIDMLRQLLPPEAPE